MLIGALQPAYLAFGIKSWHYGYSRSNMVDIFYWLVTRKSQLLLSFAAHMHS
jgi:hypothetical protein